MPKFGKWLIKKLLIALINVFFLITQHLYRLWMNCGLFKHGKRDRNKHKEFSKYDRKNIPESYNPII